MNTGPTYQSLEASPATPYWAIDCLEYQSCEHPEWEASWAARFLDALRAQLIGCLEGYDDAEWEIKRQRV
jgi:hypothetical protein